MKDVLIFGAGGHAKVVADILLQSGRSKVRAFVDDRLAGQSLLGIPVIEEKAAWLEENCDALVAIGDNFIRSKVVKKILDYAPAISFGTAVHPTAVIASHVILGTGVVVMANAVINSATEIGAHCIVNTSASVDHDCVLSAFSSIAPGATLGGNCMIGDYSAVSIGAVLIHGIRVGEHTVVGAGSTVTSHLPANIVAYGSPAKEIRNRTVGERYL